MTSGTLYGIGVGPGDPELITVKAVRVLEHCTHIFTATSPKKTDSLALEIARPYLSETAQISQLFFPMTKSAEVLDTAWENNARIVLNVLSGGENAAFLTLGDPLIYSTFSYLMAAIRAQCPEASIKTLPGITSFQAASARLNMPLVEAEESLLITSGAFGGNGLRQADLAAENVVLLKAYKHVPDIIRTLKETGRLHTSRAISHCSRPGERIVNNISDLEDQSPDYWTLIISKKKRQMRPDLGIYPASTAGQDHAPAGDRSF
ncbi:MAG: precorrin-2 C(20)-methyltransferase [Deltaproteobacteria bacterium]|nr:MAG: precorrin-2 C(20)-methyltransferase [Deltaproteobacteria bacterium]